MLLSLHLNKIAISLEKNETFISIQDATYYNLCYEYDQKTGNYLVPYVSLPILMNVAKKIRYPLRISETLKRFYSEKTGKRVVLESLKDIQTLQPGLIPQDIYDRIKDIQKTHGFTLSPGQEVTVAYSVIGKRIIVANDVGTGKTITVNTVAKVLLASQQIKKVLIMLPASLVKNYYDDYCKFFGKHGIIYIKKADTLPQRKKKYDDFIKCQNVHFLVVNYDKCNFDFEELQRLKIDMLIVDEFHNMKNFLSTKKSINFFKLVMDYWKPEYRIPMSGTPVENQLFDLFPIFKLIDGGHILGGMKFFQENFIEYEEQYLRIYSKRTHSYITRCELKPKGFKNKDFLHKLIKPLVIRKKLKLPVALYESEIVIDIPKQMKEKYEEIKMLYKGNSSKAYHEARQFLCDTTRHNYDNNPKIEEMENLISQTDEKFVIFSFYKCTIYMLEEYFKKKGYKTLSIHGDDPRDPLDVIKEFRDTDARFLLCTDKVNYGQNIQFCRYMIQWEKPIKPTIEIQRKGRLYRTGQTNDVHVYSFVVADTVEEKILDLFNSKKSIIENVVESLNDKDLQEMEKEIEKKVMSEFN